MVSGVKKFNLFSILQWGANSMHVSMNVLLIKNNQTTNLIPTFSNGCNFVSKFQMTNATPL
jgi:hypothetical protein